MGTIILQNVSVKFDKGSKKYQVKAAGGSTNSWDWNNKRIYESYTNEYDTARDAVISLVDWVFQTRQGKATYKIIAMFEFIGLDFPKYEDKEWKNKITDKVAEQLLNAYKKVVKKNRIIFINGNPLSKVRISIFGTSRAEYAWRKSEMKVMSFAEYTGIKEAFKNYEVTQQQVDKQLEVVQ